jgi:C-terminal processing protease CtpA/Prc
MKKIILGVSVLILLLVGVATAQAQVFSAGESAVSTSYNPEQASLVQVEESAPPIVPQGSGPLLTEGKENPNGFGGIGVFVSVINNVLTVIDPIYGTPAYDAGIKAGDEILKVDSIDTSSLTLDKDVSLIRGTVGTTVSLSILRAGTDQPTEITLTRAFIDFSAFSELNK